MKQHVLFVCEHGVSRCRTAEVLCLLGGLLARSCGTHEEALSRINPSVVLSAHQIVCMDAERERLVRQMMAAEGKPIVSLDIPDDFAPFDVALIDLIETKLRERLPTPHIVNAFRRGHEYMRDHGYQFEDPAATNVVASLRSARRGGAWG